MPITPKTGSLFHADSHMGDRIVRFPAARLAQRGIMKVG